MSPLVLLVSLSAQPELRLLEAPAQLSAASGRFAGPDAFGEKLPPGAGGLRVTSDLGCAPPLGVRGASPAEATSRGLFATYLVSAIEVIQEFRMRMQSLAAVPALMRGAAARGPIAAARSSAQLAAAEADLVEMLPLMQVASAGLTGWICLSRDLDEAGVVQRERALPRLMGELSDLLLDLAEVPSLCASGALTLTQASTAAVQAAKEEARHSLQQLVLCFEHAGLQELELPPRHKAILLDLTDLASR